MALLCNDLTKAISRADDESLALLPVFVAYLYWDVPSGCWGNYAIVNEWIAKKRRRLGHAQEQ